MGNRQILAKKPFFSKTGTKVTMVLVNQCSICYIAFYFMSRDYKNLTKEYCYHIYNRGHGYKNIYNDDQDYLNFMKRLAILLNIEPQIRKKHGQGNLRLTPVPLGSFDIIAYCFMPNHFHLLIRQNTELKISVLMNRLGTSYSKYFNSKNSTVGSLFQDTFKAKVIENTPYLAYLTAYIHNNPEDLNYPYSSFGEYMGLTKGICNTDLVMGMFNNNPEYYKDFVLKSKYLPLRIIWGQR
jgi:putative transposase